MCMNRAMRSAFLMLDSPMLFRRRPTMITGLRSRLLASTFHVLIGITIALGLIAATWSVRSSAAQNRGVEPLPGPDSQVQPDAPTGEVITGEFDKSTVYPGTWREYWVYVPKRLDRSKPEVPRHHSGSATGVAVERGVRRPQHGRDLRHERRQSVQAEDKGARRSVLAPADQAGSAAVVRK